MDTKFCKRCQQEKAIDNFHKDSSTKDGLRFYCKICANEIRSINHTNNKDKDSKVMQDYYKENSDIIKLKSKLRQEKYKEEIKVYKHNYYQKYNKSKTRIQYNKICNNCNEEFVTFYETVQFCSRSCYCAFRHRKKIKSDINYKIAHNLRKRLGEAIRGNWKSGSAVRDLGCSIDFLKVWLSVDFPNNSDDDRIMSWNNYGEWHIDHIVPLINFKLENREEFLKACHYTNLQALWAKDNFSKHDKLDWKK